jgi:hypothetical protein
MLPQEFSFAAGVDAATADTGSTFAAGVATGSKVWTAAAAGDMTGSGASTVATGVLAGVLSGASPQDAKSSDKALSSATWCFFSSFSAFFALQLSHHFQ